jgi:putative colanic acid biosynthesis UDP-glucose lipid carrier transferase
VHGGITLLGCFDDRSPERTPAARVHPRLGALADVAAYAKRQRVHLVYLSLPMASQPRIRALLETLQDTTASVYFVPDLFVTDLIQGRADTVCGLPVIGVCETPFRGPAGLLKRASDLAIAGMALVVLAPLMAVLAVAVKLSSPGPVIFRQRRYGLDGQEIIVYKFRSMTVVEDGPTIVQAQRGDARITRLGAFMRRTSLDELPQFINVLQGRMSVVGPRPHAVAHNELYRTQIRSYMVRHKVRPGITGWAQVNGLRGETQSLERMQARVRLDLEYLRRWSLGLDLVIIARTVRLVFKDSAAY